MTIELPADTNPVSGLTAEEQRVIDRSVDLWHALRDLPAIGGTDDMRDGTQAIHTIQRIVATRAMARLFSETWR